MSDGYWAITAQIETGDELSGGTHQVPTFYLNERVQGITSEDHAMLVAHGILRASANAVGQPAPVIHITAVRL